ncbi:MAG: cellulose biosynthesis protein BcsG, partial [Gammaproteobacteria bacterium]|nr:cellulose biosynthesis protein BcsG [Gammaproteobacteria bacterium]
MVVFIPEHGAALRGEKTQIAGMRELPSPAITEVPVGIKFVGLPGGAAFKSRTVISKPVSYLALTSLMADLMTANPYVGSSFDFAPHLDPLPETAFVAENDKTVMMRVGTSYYLRPPDLRWLKYDTTP